MNRGGEHTHRVSPVGVTGFSKKSGNSCIKQAGIDKNLADRARMAAREAA